MTALCLFLLRYRVAGAIRLVKASNGDRVAFVIDGDSIGVNEAESSGA
ncbi:hypothetical protein [uncultured Tateyamaria sp.]|nr:hypothetical protein [uncultured Tateyamaria sp.]